MNEYHVTRNISGRESSGRMVKRGVQPEPKAKLTEKLIVEAAIQIAKMREAGRLTFPEDSDRADACQTNAAAMNEGIQHDQGARQEMQRGETKTDTCPARSGAASKNSGHRGEWRSQNGN